MKLPSVFMASDLQIRNGAQGKPEDSLVFWSDR